MSTIEEPVTRPITPSLRADTLAASIVVLIVMTVVQRLVGFGREILFCRWLAPEQLGEWNLAFGFLNLLAPLAVLGLPGSFGRYVEHYRQRGQLRTFLKRTALLTLFAGLTVVVFIAMTPEWTSRMIFGRDDQGPLVHWMAVALGVLILNNFLVSLFVALRMIRVVNVMQFIQSIGFAAFSLLLLRFWDHGPVSVAVGFTAVHLVTSLLVLVVLREAWAGGRQPATAVSLGSFWGRLLPFAMWIWLTNLVANLFDLVDRYMIVHFSQMANDEALWQVGNYHSSRLVPTLCVALAGLIGAVITPHLTQDWEAGRRGAVSARLNVVVKGLALFLLVGFVLLLVISPVLFDVAFEGKYAGGLAVLPWTLAYCSWFGIFAVAQNYLWCAEQAKLSTLALLVGLLLNIGCNLLLLPLYGLAGAVWATAIANFVAILLLYWFSQWRGMHIELGTWILTLAAGALGFGPLVAGGVLLAILIAAATTNAIFTIEQKSLIVATCHSALRKLKRSPPNAEPAAM